MVDPLIPSGATDGASDSPGELGIPELETMVDALSGLATNAASDGCCSTDTGSVDAHRIELITVLEQLQSASSAAVARISVDFDTSQRDAQRLRGVPACQLGRGVADQLALARRVTPSKASRDLAHAKDLVGDLRHTFNALAHGAIHDDTAAAIRRETTHLDANDRVAVDDDLHTRGLPGIDAVEARNATKQCALQHDPLSASKRAARAVAGRSVRFTHDVDVMASINARLPAPQAVAVHHSLREAAETIIATGLGDGRGVRQIIADVFVERLTGQGSAPAVPLEVQLVMTPDALLSQGDTPENALAWLDGYGPIPAAIARATLAGVPDILGAPPHRLDQGQAWVRRLFTDPINGTLIDADARRRKFSGTLRRFVQWRDRVCRTPFCDVAIHDIDHAHPYAAGGTTTLDNALGLCRRFNLVKELPGWIVQVDHEGPPGSMHTHTATITTPTGHTYLSRLPAQPVQARPVRGRASRIEAAISRRFRLDPSWAA